MHRLYRTYRKDTMARYINPTPQILDGNGNPIVGARKYMFEPGSSTLKTIYSDSALSLATVNPVVSDSSGRFPDIFLDGTYKEVQTDENGITLWTRDPVGVEAIGEWTLWDAGTTYSIPQITLGSDDEYYRSLVDSNIGNDPTSSPASWEQLYLGRIWNANVTYSITDTVYGSDGFIYKSQINSNLNNDPTTDFVNWWPGAPDHLSVTAAGTNTYTATYGETAYKSGRPYYITITNASTSTTPTLNLDSLGAKTIKKDGGDALVSGDMPAGHEAIFRYDGTDMILLNPKVQVTVIFGESFASSEQTITTAGQLVLAHSLSSQPHLLAFTLICKTTDAGYAVDDEVEINISHWSGATFTRGGSLITDATNVTIRFSDDTSCFMLGNKGTGTAVPLTNANWKLVVRAWV